MIARCILTKLKLKRKICKKCAESKKISSEDSVKIKKALKGLPKEIKVPKLTPGIKILRAKGCKYCNFTGYQGRIAIFEAFLIDDETEKFILTSPSIGALRKLAIKKGMVLMRQDGFIKVLEGTTTIEEVDRVTFE